MKSVQIFLKIDKNILEDHIPASIANGTWISTKKYKLNDSDILNSCYLPVVRVETTSILDCF